MFYSSIIPIDIPALAREKHLLFLDKYSVTVNNISLEVRQCRESAVPFNRIWPGVQRQCDQTTLAGFVNFYSDEPVKVVIKSEFFDNKTVVIRPLSKKVEWFQNENTIEFFLNKPGQYVVESSTISNNRQQLYLFFNPIKEELPPKDKKWYFGPGLHFPGIMKLSTNSTVYIDKDAIVFGCIYGNDVHNVKIFGGGVLHSGMEGRVFGSFCENVQYSSLKFYNSTNINISDIIVQDSPCWTTSFFGCSNINIDNIKIIGQYRYNNDGIDFCNCQNVKVINSFVRSFDDAIVLKGIDHMDLKLVSLAKGQDVKNIKVENCILWSGWGRTLEVGIETGAPQYDCIEFTNCDLIHNSATCLDVQNGNFANIHNVVFKNIRVEYQTTTLPEVYQKSDDMKYDSNGKMGVPRLIVVDNHRYGGQNGKFGDTYDILFEDIQVFAENGVPEKLPILLANHSDTAKVENITFKNITVNGKLFSSPEDFDFEILGNVEGIYWK